MNAPVQELQRSQTIEAVKMFDKSNVETGCLQMLLKSPLRKSKDYHNQYHRQEEVCAQKLLKTPQKVISVAKENSLPKSPSTCKNVSPKAPFGSCTPRQSQIGPSDPKLQKLNLKPTTVKHVVQESTVVKEVQGARTEAELQLRTKLMQIQQNKEKLENQIIDYQKKLKSKYEQQPSAEKTKPLVSARKWNNY